MEETKDLSVCKHKEIGVEIEYQGNAYIEEYVCKNENCTKIFGDVVILTKERHQQLVGVVGALKAEKDKYNEWVGMEWDGEIDQAFLVFRDKKKDVYNEFRELEKKSNELLDALGGE